MLRPGPYAWALEVTLADVCLVPQVFNARRMKVPLDNYPKIVAVDAACAKLAAFSSRIPTISRTPNDASRQTATCCIRASSHLPRNAP